MEPGLPEFPSSWTDKKLTVRDPHIWLRWSFQAPLNVASESLWPVFGGMEDLLKASSGGGLGTPYMLDRLAGLPAGLPRRSES